MIIQIDSMERQSNITKILKQNGDEMWFEYKDTNLQIYYLKESGD